MTSCYPHAPPVLRSVLGANSRSTNGANIATPRQECRELRQRRQMSGGGQAFSVNAGERTRTSKGFHPPTPKAGVSTNSTTPARRQEPSSLDSAEGAAGRLERTRERRRLYGQRCHVLCDAFAWWPGAEALRDRHPTQPRQARGAGDARDRRAAAALERSSHLRRHRQRLE